MTTDTITTQQNPVGAVMATTLGAGAFYDETLLAVYELRWMLVLMVVLVIVDFLVGTGDSITRHGEGFRFSRAGRRTFLKLIEYFAYLVLGVIVGKAICEPLDICDHIVSSAVASCFALLWEVDSIASHVCSLHGVEYGKGMKKFIVSLVKRKNKDIGEALEETIMNGDNSITHNKDKYNKDKGD